LGEITGTHYRFRTRTSIDYLIVDIIATLDYIYNSVEQNT